MTDPNQSEEIYEVEKIVKHRYVRKRIEYLVKWKDYGDEDNTWQGPETLQDARELVDEYWENREPTLPPPKASTKVAAKTPAKSKGKAPAKSKVPVKIAPAKVSSKTPGKVPSKAPLLNRPILPKALATSSSQSPPRPSEEPTYGKKRPQQASLAETSSTTISLQKKAKLRQPQVIPHDDETPSLTLLDHTSLQTPPTPSLPSTPMTTRIYHDKVLDYDNGDKQDVSNTSTSSSSITSTSTSKVYVRGLDINDEDNTKDYVTIDEPEVIQKNTIDFAGKKLNVDDTLHADRNWEVEVAKIETMKIRKDDGVTSFDLVVRWDNGDLTAHTSNFVKTKCPQMVFDFYEKRIASFT